MTNYIRIIIFIALTSLTTSLMAQKSLTLYSEILGNGYDIASLNIDYRFDSREIGWGVRLGYALGGSADVIAMGNFLIGPNKHKLELGAGLMNFSSGIDDGLFVDNVNKGIKPTANISYRYHAENGLMFKAGWTPILVSGSSSLITWGGLGLGWRF